ncbi:BQ5605_C027g10338 [Microbotryum silenes-dioicae]|uniref:BQ5605_C027g10338 protein n=1 Tax=Microbotryum silenes-dioicae TaxID=796604 RepID=A0A2X0MNA1_9BASI|nr:BQ5605_C027g10338 [Microbotryum silenes-dioicae]
MESLAGKQLRTSRSRAACAGCRATKQKCDGPSRIPCRRCELYGLACEYPPVQLPPKPSANPRAAGSAAPAVASTSSSLPPTSQLSHQPSFVAAGSSESVLNETLREIVDRLRSLEASVTNLHLNSNTFESTSQSEKSADPLLIAAEPYPEASEPTPSDSPDSGDGQQIAPSSTLPCHALQNISATIDFIEALETSQMAPALQDLDGFAEAARSTFPTLESMLPDTMRPDAIDRGILSIAEVEANFLIFFRMLAPWILVFDLSKDSNAMEVRERCPLLFHTILTSTGYYLMGTSERGTKVYKALVALTNELIAPIIISTQVYDLNSDLLRALCLLMMYKPVQLPAFHFSGRVHTAERAEQYAKLNTTSSFVLWGIIARVSTRIGLPSVPSLFAKLYSPDVPVPASVVADLRLWMWIIVIDNHATLTIGRPTTLDMTDVLRATRLLASLKLQTGDVRLAALVELYAVSRHSVSKAWFTDFTKRAPAYELRKFNRDLDEWEQYWSEPLEAAAKEGDALAMHPIYVISQLIRAIINSTVFMRWQRERRVSLAKGLNERPEMSSDDWNSLQITLDAVERQIFALSAESRVEGSQRREVHWASRPFDIPKGGRPFLTLDQKVVDVYRTAFDPIICVAFVYPLLLVSRMCNAALVNCELKVKDQNAYDSGSLTLNKPQFMIKGAKVARLLDLSSRFLDAVAPTPSHPAKRHARILRAMFVLGSVDLSQLPNTPRRDSVVEPVLDEATTIVDLSHSNSHSPALSSSSQPPPSYHGHQQKDPTDSKSSPRTRYPSAQTSFDLLGPSTDQPIEAGEMLHSILSGIDLTFFGQEMAYGLEPARSNADPVGDGGSMMVDWANLDNTINSVEPLPQFLPSQMDYFEMLARQGQI